MIQDSNGTYRMAFTNSSTSLYMSNSSDGTHWSVPQQLGTYASISYPFMVQDSSGKLHVYFNTGAASESEQYSVNGVNWTSTNIGTGENWNSPSVFSWS